MPTLTGIGQLSWVLQVDNTQFMPPHSLLSVIEDEDAVLNIFVIQIN